jgi:hypothetical protein
LSNRRLSDSSSSQSPRRAGDKISFIAFDAGFADVSYFNRAPPALRRHTFERARGPADELRPAPTRRAQSLYCAARRHRLLDVADERPRRAIASDKPGTAVGQWRNRAIAPYALALVARIAPITAPIPAPARHAFAPL